MIKNILVLCFFCASFSGVAFCQETTEIDSQVVSVSLDKEYLIIKAGETAGVEIGDGLIIHREGEKIAEAQIIEVRPEVAAAEILHTEKAIKEGDNALIVKKTKKRRDSKKEKPYLEPKKSKWTTLLGSGAKIDSVSPVETVKQGRIQTGHGSGAVSTGIDINPSVVFSYALMVLRENGYSVIFSSRVTGVISATKPVELSIMKELWADATAKIEHKIVVSIEIKNNGGVSELNITGFKEHSQKGKQVKFPIARGSKYYGDLADLVSKIKERAGF
ncbi:MAG: hypothetical protein V1752_07120 [Candidatus Firestonebacteria bacterium]